MFYEKYYPGKLISQTTLCRALRRHRAYAIDFDQANPMTIRLLFTHAALDGIGEVTRRVDHFARQVRLNNPPMTSGINLNLWLSTSPPLSGSGASVLHDPNAEEKLKVRLIDLHKHLYSFYTNGGSCLDRLGWEVNRVYELGLSDRAVGFGAVKNKVLKNKSQWPHLYQLFSDPKYKDRIEDFKDYRNRMVHDGIVPLDVRDRVYLPDGFDEQHQPTVFSREPVGLCQQHFAAIEGLVDATYQVMWEEYQSTKRLPLTGQ